MRGGSFVRLPGLGRVFVARAVLSGRAVGQLVFFPGGVPCVLVARGLPDDCNHLVCVSSRWFFWCSSVELI